MSKEKTFYIKYGKWYKIKCCKKCDEELNVDDRLGELCPHCGYVTNLTNLYNVKILRKAYTYIPPIWKFWEKSKYDIEELKK